MKLGAPSPNSLVQSERNKDTTTQRFFKEKNFFSISPGSEKARKRGGTGGKPAQVRCTAVWGYKNKAR
jgi:hypothetical protein